MLAAGIGKVAAAGTDATEKTRIGMQQQLMDLDEKKADAKESIKQQTIAMDVGAAADQQKIAKEKEIEAAKAKTAAINQGVKGVVGAASLAAPLYGGKKLTDDEMQQMLAFLGESGQGFSAFGVGSDDDS